MYYFNINNNLKHCHENKNKMAFGFWADSSHGSWIFNRNTR